MAKLLLVEDNEWNRDMLSRRLEKRGYEVLIAVDGEEAITLTGEILPDAVLMDLTLPGDVDGCEATRRTKANPETSAIPVIVLTANATVEIEKEAREAGCDEFLTKPVEFEELLAVIERHLNPPEGGEKEEG